MPENFYTDNEDLQFHMTRMVDWHKIIEMREHIGAEDSPYDSAEEAVETFLDMLQDPIGELAAQRLAPRAEEIDKEGCTLQDGKVILPIPLQRNLEDLSEADLMGIPLPRKYGGLEFPKTFYSAAIEIVSRADASLMNFFGLQGIAETLAEFGSEEQQQQYLPGMASGALTGAMVLTEPDAGSDLAAVRSKADIEAKQDPQTGEWRIQGTKRFITNGCGDVLIVLARSEDPEKYKGGRGLSLFVVEKSEAVQVRRIEHKLGIHGSPTCELFFDSAPAQLIGNRGWGLIKYTSWLMSAARLAVAGQSLGICEAALREAKKYADEREQFGKKIKAFPQVAAILADMQVETEAVRSLVFDTSFYVDLMEGAVKKERKEEARKYTKIAEVLTPIVKYYASEMCIKIANDAIQIHGGSGYMQEYPVERLYRDARITNIYEGTSQIQINWAIARILKGDLTELLDSYSGRQYSQEELTHLIERVNEAYTSLKQTIDYVNAQDSDYRELVARRIVDMVIDVYVAYLLIAQAEHWDKKVKSVRHFINGMMPRVEMNRQYAMSGNQIEIDV